MATTQVLPETEPQPAQLSVFPPTVPGAVTLTEVPESYVQVYGVPVPPPVPVGIMLVMATPVEGLVEAIVRA